MKNLLLLIFLSLGLSFLLVSCEDDIDPCESVRCDQNLSGNFCENGACTCETNNWSYITWTFACTNCPSNLESLFIDVEINNVKLTDVILADWSDYRRTIEERLSNISGTVPYKVTSGTVVLEEGFLNITECEELVFTSNVSI